jgi:DHA2 family multidrug resistance protein
MRAAPPNTDHDYPDPSVRWMIAISVSFAALLEVIDTSIVNVALTDMQATLGATLSEIGWVVTSYAIANVIMIPLSPWLGDAFGKKRYFVFSMVGFTAASVMCGMAQTLDMMILARILQGLAGGGLLAKAQAFLFESFPRAEHGRAQAIFTMCVIAGPAIGPTLGGYIVTNFSWPWIFFINLPVGIVGCLMCISFLPHDKAVIRGRAIDYLGIGLLIVWIGSLQTLLEQGNENGWFDSTFIKWLGVSALVGGLVWIWHELRSRAPAVDLRVLKHKELAAGSVYGFVLGTGLYGAIFAIPIYCQQVLGYSAYQTGMLLMPGALASAAVTPFMGKLVNMIDSRILIAVGSCVFVASLLALSRISISSGPDDFLLPLLGRGAGVAMIFLPLSLATFGSLPRNLVSAGSGFFNLTRQMGGSVGIALMTTFLAQRETLHRARLSEYVNAYSGPTQERLNAMSAGFMQKGYDSVAAHKMALGALNGSVNLQSAVLSFSDTFLVVAILFIVSLGLLVFMGSGKASKAPAEVH